VEALAESQVAPVAVYADMLQLGARNMQNVPLLRAAARSGRPILLKRGPSATLDELLCAAEYILLEGNPSVVLCERGIRSFDAHTRNVCDLGGALRLRELTHLPVIVDPSHASGRRSLVRPLALAAAAAGLDGAIVEVHPDPDAALSDREQSIAPAEFSRLAHEVRVLRGALAPSEYAVV
ncbi:MAG: 3-deoxy-7-phosphoheptulonate synthase, partial [Vulcanimicrobiaceae bacterium]